MSRMVAGTSCSPTPWSSPGAGITRVFRRSSSRRDENTGDAMRLALEAGCSLRDMELVQFHPTGRAPAIESAGRLLE